MNKLWLKLCSLFLTTVLLINMLPLQAFAEQIQAAQEETRSIETGLTKEEVSLKEVATGQIVGELADKRTEYTKQFLLDNGLYMATVYSEPVHYKENGLWTEIDNTLKAQQNGTYTNTAGIWNVSFPSQLTKDNKISVTKDGYTLSFGMAGELRTGSGFEIMSIENANVIAASTQTTVAEMLSVNQMQASTAQLEEIDTSAIKAESEHPETIVDKLNAGLLYKNVYGTTDVRYALNSNTVKESVVLKSYSNTLRGYRYVLDVGQMNPVLQDDGSIRFYDRENKNIVMVINAPFLVDAAHAYNNDIQVQLTGNGNSYILTYLLPTQWLAAEERAWPVILDPVVQPQLTTTNIRDRTVVNQGSFSQTWGMNSCGLYSNGDITRTFLKYDNLPVLSSSDVVIGATVNMYKPNASSTVTPVFAHKVLGTWDSETISWANKPDFDPTIEDYAIVDAVGWYGWDITDVVRGWYAGENTGVMFKASDEIENGNSANFKEFYSSDFGTEPTRPVLSIIFRNNNGLESYWDYSSISNGVSDTAYINNYTGNLIWVRNIVGFGGNRMPVSINHIYNANDAYLINDNNNSNNTAGNGFGMGNGWRTNYNQLIYQWSTNSSYYIWEDSDGTDHYFYFESNGVYKDEDGLELTLTTTGSGTETYRIEDKKGNTSYFDQRGRLSKIQNNQATPSNITITYVGTTNRISSITDGVGRKYQFVYNSDLLESIIYVGSGSSEIYSTTFEYQNNNLSCITDNIMDCTEYTYGANNLLISATDLRGYTLTCSYNTMASGKPARIHTVEETHNGTTGGRLTFDYGHNHTAVTDRSGNTLVYQFNNLGNTISVQNDEGHAQYYKYAINDSPTENAQNTDPTAKGNQLIATSKLQNTVVNTLKDSSFEAGNLWGLTGGNATATIVTGTAYYGNHSMYVTTSAAETGVKENTYTLGVGETVTLSAYVKTGSASVAACIFDGSTQTMGGELLPYSNWTRVEVIYTNESSSPKNINPRILALTPGTFWMDNAQLEFSASASRYNLVENGDFRHYHSGWSSDAGFWIIPSAVPSMQDTVYKMTGTPTGQNRISQTVAVAGAAGDSFVLAGWAKGNSAPLREEGDRKREFALQLIFNYTDGTSSNPLNSQFNPDSNLWQYAAVAAVAEKAYASVTVWLIYDYNVNTVYFDGIQLFKEEFGTSYTYDGDGNVISVVDLQKKETTYEYDANSNLTQILQDNKAKMTYEYDGYHNVSEAISEEGLTYHFIYDTYGNNTAVFIDADMSTILSTAAYTADGNRLVSTTDALGNVTTYGYDANTNTLDWVQYPGETEATRTNYFYDGLYRLDYTMSTADTGDDLFASYVYSGNHLVGIQAAATSYYFDRGDFGLVQSVSTGDYILANYQYTNDGNNLLSRLDYGNNDRVNYTYDDNNKGRLTKETFEDGDTVSYTYSSSGNLAAVTDSATGITTAYYYDLLDRMIKYRETGGNRNHSVEYTYNSDNNLVALEENINGTDHTTTYTYDDDNRVTSVSNSSASTHYTYDAFGRLSGETTKHGGTNILTESYTFTNPSPGTTSGQVSTNRLQAAGYDTTYTYTYDGKGNILSVSDGTNTTTYVYDSDNQLIRENNQAGGFTHTWEYGGIGNILNRKEYAYTTGALGTPIDTVTYSYDDFSWGDLLTGYDGQTITHDGIGNPLFDGTWTYTWEHGRELASMTSGATTWNYTYDADGMRTQRTNGSTTYSYIYNGGSLSQMTVGNNTLYFAYDAVGMPMAVTYNGTTYYYVTNLQGDVIAILNSSGTPVVNYSYDAWGNPISTTGTMATTLGTLNPLRYRSYVYDDETGLYYLQSRYYNPEWGRFLNADGLAATGQGILGNNMFTYCNNNPVIFKDVTGYVLCTAIGAFIGGVFGAISAAIDGKTGDEFKASVLAGVTSGAVSGAAADILLVTGGSAGVVVGVMAAAGAIGSVAGNAVEAKVTGEPMDWKQTAVDVAWDGASGALFGYMGGAIASNIGNIVKKGFVKTAKKIVLNELRDISSTIAEEFLSNATSSIASFAVDIVKDVVSRLWS